MSIRLKIALWFTVLVSGLLFISFWTINEWLSSKNKFQFQQRLKNRTIATARLWTASDTLIQNVMPNLDSGSVASLKNKYVAIYDDNERIHYHFSDYPPDTITPAQSYFKKAKDKGEAFFSAGKRNGYLLRYIDEKHKLFILTIAYDEYHENVSNNLKTILWVIA
ncbi:MAG: hypothetical protein ACRDE5_16525, partial [Ginsengibacter sp.]